MLMTFAHSARTIAIVGSLVAVVACSSSDSAAEKAYNDSMAACERLQNTDQRQNCFDAAMKKYQTAKSTANASTCPKSSC